jgi:Na+-translocating ferredoxin:NAD+ oxidoreductase RNF subunit RnfB
VAWDEPHVSVGGLLEACGIRKKGYFGKKACKREAIVGRKRSMHACIEDLMTLGLGFL